MTRPDGYFFDGGGRRRAVDAIFEGVYRAEAVLLLIGAAGSGRSAVLDRFVAEADPHALAIALVRGDIMMSADQALWALAGQLDENGGPGSAQDAFFDGVERCRAEGRNIAILIDDAHELGEETRLAVVTAAREAGVGIVLTGDESLAPAMNPEVPFIIHTLRSLSEQETESFVAGWLAVQDEDELPSHRTISRLHRHSAGMPGRLAGLLGAGAADRTTLLPNGIPLWHALIAAVAIALLGWMVAQVSHDPVRETGADATETELALPPSGGAAPSAPVVDVAEEPAPRVAVAAVPQPIDVHQPAAYVPPEPPPPVDSGSKSLVKQEPSAAVPAVAAPTRSSAPAPGGRLSASPVRNAPQAPTRYTADEEALLARKSSQYVLQVFGSFNEASVRNFLAAHPALSQARLFRTVREELPWHVLVVGDFPNREEARNAVGRLPADIQALKPWARSMQGIQDELRRRGE